MNLTQQEYEKIVSEVESAFEGYLAKSEKEDTAKLAKADQEDEHEEAVADIADEQEKPEEAPMQAEAEAPAPAEEAPMEEQPEQQMDGGYSDEEMQALHGLYDAMPEAELQAHMQVLQSAMAKFAPEAEQAPEADQDMDKCGEMKVITKSEPSAELELMKSEISNKDKEIDGLKKSIEELVNAMGGFLTKKAPARKAVTELQVIAKSESETTPKEEPLTHNEILVKLSRKASEHSLAKSDRELINLYTLKKVGLEKIQHLLK